ncbi:hypothetical protein CHS0354_008084 [Potamilus streckersoni]|uniref:Uncharacterized protein n=1 Tax=Potamilus streckersoni TaxID=2493646 RepID=A0AAE0W3R1_9BIVA|nr:hypothetical protein CHS0354_008084 [Potamilus streckersoni]
MKFLIAILVLAGVAYAQNFSVDMGYLSMPDVPERMTLDGLKYILKNITPAFRERLDFILSLLGLGVNDLEEALDNPPDEIKEIFGTSGMSISDIQSMVDNLPESLKEILESEK